MERIKRLLEYKGKVYDMMKPEDVSAFTQVEERNEEGRLEVTHLRTKDSFK